MVNIISGGAHAGAAIDVQDFLAVPLHAQSFREAIDAAARVRRATAEVFAERGLVSTLVADEGGLAAPLPANRVALEILTRGIERAGFVPGTDIGIAIDVAASQQGGRGEADPWASEPAGGDSGEPPFLCQQVSASRHEPRRPGD